MKKILLVRSASYYQFEKNLAAVRNFFPEAEISLIEHRARLTEARKFSGQIRQFLVYPSDGPFTATIPQDFEEGARFDDAIVQYANVDGEGHDNVNHFAFTLPADRIWFCNVDSEILPLTRMGYWSRKWFGRAKALLNLCWLLILTPVFIVAVPFVYFFKVKKEP